MRVERDVVAGPWGLPCNIEDDPINGLENITPWPSFGEQRMSIGDLDHFLVLFVLPPYPGGKEVVIGVKT
jgi:hypothetical protein